MKLKRTLQLCSLFYLCTLISCYDDDCGDFKVSNYHINGLSGINIRLDNENYYVYDTLSNHASISNKHYGIHILPQTAYVAMQETTQSRYWYNIAYACSPVPPQPTEEIADIAIFSNANFVQASSSKVLAAGDTLNSVFEIYDYYSGRIVGLPDFLVDDDLAASEDGFVLRPTVAVASPQLHQFTVHYRLTNGEFYTYEAPPVTLIP